MERGSEAQGNHRFASEQIGRERMSNQVPGIPEGFELVRFGSPKKGEWVLFTPVPYQTSIDDYTGFWPIVRRIEEPSPGEGWRLLNKHELIACSDEVWLGDKWDATGMVGMRVVDAYYRRRIGPRLRKVGERLQRGDEFMNARGFWQPISPDMIGMEVVGGRYYAEK